MTVHAVAPVSGPKRFGGTNNIVSYQYDAAGRRSQRTLENNTFTLYGYDSAGQLTNIWHQQTVGATTNLISQYQYGYDNAGNRLWVKRAHQSNQGDVYAYDAADQLTDVKYNANNPDGSASGWSREVTYFYDTAGNRTGMVERIGGATNTTSYTANTDNQLTSATTTRQGLTVTGIVGLGTYSNKWYGSTAASHGVTGAVSSTNGTFSLSGVPVRGGANALTVTVTDVSGNIATQVVNVTIATNATALGYSGTGNQTNDAVWAYAYDTENHLVSAISTSSVVQYTYDGAGRLIQRIAGNSTNRLYYAGWQLIAEYDGAGNLQRKYVYGPGIDEPIRMTAGGTNYYYHVDGLGSVAQFSGPTGALVEQYTYDVYGAPTFYNGSGDVTNNSAIGNRLLFTGRDRDQTTGWYNYRRRYYNPMLGRFIQPDPIGIASGDLNLYRYGRNAPVLWRDPLGLISLEDQWNLVVGLQDQLYTYYIQGGQDPETINDLIDAIKEQTDYYNELKAAAGATTTGACLLGGLSAGGVLTGGAGAGAAALGWTGVGAAGVVGYAVGTGIDQASGGVASDFFAYILSGGEYQPPVR